MPTYLVMLLNFLVDFFLLLGANSLSGFPSAYGKVAAGALLGALYSGGCLLPGFRFLGALPWRIVCACLMSAIAFGVSRSAGKRCGVFLILSMALCGGAELLDRGGAPGVLLSGALIALLCWFSFGERVGGQEYLRVELEHGGNRVELVALRDTGNTLRDPVTGEQVLVIGEGEARRLTGLTRQELREPLQTLCRRRLPGLRLIPYKTVNTAGGLLLAMRLEHVRLNGKERPTIVAFAPEKLGAGNYQALAGGNL